MMVRENGIHSVVEHATPIDRREQVHRKAFFVGSLGPINDPHFLVFLASCEEDDHEERGEMSREYIHFFSTT